MVAWTNAPRAGALVISHPDWAGDIPPGPVSRYGVASPCAVSGFAGTMMSQFTLAASVMIGALPVAAGPAAVLLSDGVSVEPTGDCWAAVPGEPPPPLNAMTAPIIRASTTGIAKGIARRPARLRARRRRHADRCLLAINPPPRARHRPQGRRLDQACGQMRANHEYQFPIPLNLAEI